MKRLQKRDEKPEEKHGAEEIRQTRPTTRLFRKWDGPVQPDQAVEQEKPDRVERGHTLLEMIATVAIIGCLLVGLFKLFASANTLFRAGDAKADLEERGRIAVMSMVNELRQSGYMTDGVTGKSYPYIFTNGSAQAPFASYSHTPAQHQAEAGTAAYGPTHEIVFRMTADLDGDGLRTAHATGAVEWSPDEVAYVLVTAADGVNQIERRVNNASPKIVARYVERMCFDDNATDSSVPYGQIRLTVHMRKTTTDGRVVKASYSTLVKMRNYEG
jgi:type II secretory pathway component PulJ